MLLARGQGREEICKKLANNLIIGKEIIGWSGNVLDRAFASGYM